MTLLGFLRGPFGGLSDESLVRLCHDGSLLSAFHGGLVPQDFESSQADALVAARTLLADLRSRTELPLPAFLRYAIERTGCEAIALSQFLGVRKARNVRKLIDLADGFSRTRAPRLERFVQYVEEVGSMDVREGDAALEAGGAEAVTLMTIHKAKGLEFPIVVVPDVSSELRGPDPLPIAVDRDLGLAASTEDEFGSRVKPPLYELITRRHRDNARAESARLLYVAMTRARDWLLLSGAPLSRGDSWQAHFDEQYGLLKRADGDQIAGTGWSATVRRTAPPDPRTAPRKEPRDVLEEDLVRKRLAEVCVHRDPARPFTVTEVAAKMASMGNDFPAPDPRSLDTPTPVQDDKPAADPRRRGTLLHRVLQQWDFHSDVGPVVDRILRSSAPSLAARRGDEDYLNQRAAVFRSSSIGKRVADEVLEGTAHREQPFTLRLGGALVSGMMDIVLADGTIIDYKTGTGPPHRRVEYEWQIRLYAAALGTLRNRDVPAAHLCYVDGDEIHGVDVSTERLDETVRLAHEAIRALQHQENA